MVSATGTATASTKVTPYYLKPLQLLLEVMEICFVLKLLSLYREQNNKVLYCVTYKHGHISVVSTVINVVTCMYSLSFIFSVLTATY